MENIETLLAAVAQTQGFDDDEPVVSTSSEVRSEPSPVIRDTSRSQLIGEVSGDARPSMVVDKLLPAPTSAFPAVGRVIAAGEKRKRGRPPKGQPAGKPPSPKLKKIEDEEDDVCFICFDGGSLVLCDRKGCPKAYHPACIKRDEAFFKSKAKWNCGWHICSVCQKASQYMCYTCTYSLCKGCAKDTDYLCVRGNKGFCSTCMKMIMLIENKDQATSESVQVDFDDVTSWEYLFKVYWVLLKEKLSLTLSELEQAKNPWRGATVVASKLQFSNVLHTAVGGEVSTSCRSTEQLELNKPHVDINLIHSDALGTEPCRIDNHVEKINSDKGEHAPTYSKDTEKSGMDKVAGETSINKTIVESVVKEATDKTCIVKNQDDSSIVKDTNEPWICKNTSKEESDKPGTDSSQWASKELLEFVAHMKNGDTSPVSQFDVQTLLLDYIKSNNLRDPHQKSQIICDLRFNNLFGKPRVGHIEMLKLLEFHFLVNEDPQKSSFIPAGFVSPVATDADVDATTHGLATPINSRKRKTRKKREDKQPHNDINEYAAIDFHNINLIYLRRNLMENLIVDHESFTSKVIGSIVRIRISNNDQKTEVFRLVRVVGTSKVAVPYKIGDRTADVMLEVLNLDKKELVPVNAISNLEFTEDECRRLRQSIRCGLVKQFTVGELLKKALALQSVRVNDWLETEVMRLNHLRDRASEKGHKKELREYVDRIELLKSPEERQRRISEIPDIHADPKMDPNCESEEDTRIVHNSRKDEQVAPSYSSYPRRERKPISPNKKGKVDRSTEARSRIIEKTDASGSNGLAKHMNQINMNNTPTGGRNDQTMQRSGLEISTATASTGNSPSSDNIETEKLWHYRDPNGKIQGPFSMMQLRKWRTTGLFPLDMRIWTNHEQYDSLLLTDALSGKLHGASDLSYKPFSHSQEKRATGELGASEVSNGTSGDIKQTEAVGCDSVSISAEKNPGLVRADESGSSGWPRCWDLLKDSNPSADVQAHNSLPSSSAGAILALTDQGQKSDEVNHGGEKNSTGLAQNSMAGVHELQNQTGNNDQASQLCEENPRFTKIDLSSNIMDSGPVSPPVSMPPDSSKRVENIEVLDFPSPTPHTENQHSVSAETCILELLSPTPKSNNEYQEGQATENKQSGFTTLPNSGPGWISASNLGMGGVQLPEVADEWCGFSPTPARPPCIQEWDSGLASASSLKPPEVMRENINTSASDSHQLAHAPAPASQPTTNIPNWLTIMNEPIEFDALGEDSISDLLAEVDAMESQGPLPSPTAMKFARELMEDYRDCFSSIEEFSPTPEPRRSDAFSSTTDLQLTPPQCKPMGSSPVDAFDFFKRSSVHSSASSEGETNAPVHSGDAGSEFHPSTPNNTGQDMVSPTMVHGPGSDTMDPGWGSVQGNINLVTVQGNVNLVLGGPPTQGMGDFGWGTNPGTGRASSNISRSPRNGSLPWDGRKYGGERFSSPRERGYQGRQPWGRQAYGGGGGVGGGHSRPLPKGQRICKFYESGRCKKGAFCDFLHP